MKTILCYGDSNTYGYSPEDGLRYDESTRWTGRLQALLGDDYKIIEEGCNGRTTAFDDPEEDWKNGLPYLKPCLNSHKPIDIVILMLGSNDLKARFGLTAEEIANGAGTLVETIRDFTAEKQGFVPKIILVSPPEIGSGIRDSEFYGRFEEDAIDRSRQFPEYYKAVSDRFGCIFANAAKWAGPSEADSLHFDREGHRAFAEKMCEVVRGL